MFLTVPAGNGTIGPYDDALDKWKKLGALNFRKLFSDGVLVPAVGDDGKLLPIEMGFVDEGMLCYG